MVLHCDIMRTIKSDDILVKLVDLYHCACLVPLIGMRANLILDSDMILDNKQWEMSGMF